MHRICDVDFMYEIAMKKIMTFCALSLCLFLLIVGRVHAQGVFTPNQLVLEIPDATKVLVSDATPINTVLWTSPSVTSSLVKGTAGNTSEFILGTLMNLRQATSDSIFATTVPGIGLRIRVTFRSPYYGPTAGTQLFMSLNYFNSPGSAGITSPTTKYPQDVVMQLVKTANTVPNGKVLFNASTQLLSLDYNCVPGCQKLAFFISGSVDIESKPVCSVAASSELIDVELGHVYVHQFKGVNSTSDPKDFTMKMTCKGGTPGSKTRAYVTLTDSTQPGNVSKALSLSGAKPAGGLGIQIKRGSTILGYGPDSGAIGNTNQWVAGDINYGETEFSVPLTASYVQTGAKVTEGPANAKATFNITYN